jgi:WD40 repeat protein
VRRFERAGGKKALSEIKLSAGGAQNLTFAPDGKYLAWSSFTDGVTVWDVAAHKEAGRFGGSEGMKLRFFGQSIRFSDDGKTLAVTLANDAIELWEVASGKLVRAISGYEAERGNRVAVRIVLGSGGRMTRTDLAFSADGKTVAASLGNATVRQFDTGTGNEVAPTSGHRSGVIAVGSDGRNVVTVSKESVRVWDAAGGEVRHWSLSPPAVAAAVSPDAKRVATSPGNGVVRVWDAATGEKVREIDTKRGDVAGIAFSPDGKLIATKAELTAAVSLWDAATGDHLRTIGQDGESGFSGGRVMIESGGVSHLRVSRDGRSLVSGSVDTTALVWDLGPLPRVELAREMPLAATDLDALWADLARPDPATAFTTTRKLLTAHTQAAGLLKERLRPVPAVDDAKIGLRTPRCGPWRTRVNIETSVHYR